MIGDGRNALTRKLELFGSLPDDDRSFLDEITAQPRVVDRHIDLIREGDAPSDVHIVLKGFACRYKILRGGSRQIFAYLVPGDLCDLNVFILKAMDHGIATLSPSRVVELSRPRVLELLQRPAIAHALRLVTLVDEAILREWVVNLGQRQAIERLAHLFCELHLRLQSIGLAGDDSFALPMMQAELADTLGMSNVHMNRSLQALRENKLIRFQSRILTILDIDRLHAFCGFNPTYLHLDGGKRDVARSASDQVSRSIQGEGNRSEDTIPFPSNGERHASFLFRHR